tara:strand:+ start:12799 stop:13485 length:687 start_codon:yes stop_codon:yes gene_type:complete
LKLLIAGASGGVGSQLVKAFESSNNELVLTYNSNNSFDDNQRMKHQIIKCDFSNEDDVINLYSQVESLDIVINTFGYNKNKLIKNMKLDEWNSVINFNLTATFLSCKYAQNKIRNHGHIINISSVLGRIGSIGAANYAAAKGGVEAFTKSFALECLLKNNVYVNCIALGYFRIGMGEKLDEKIIKDVKNRIPLNSFGDPEEISNLVKYIISSRYLVGQIIHLNGGLFL